MHIILKRGGDYASLYSTIDVFLVIFRTIVFGYSERTENSFAVVVSMYRLVLLTDFFVEHALYI